MRSVRAIATAAALALLLSGCGLLPPEAEEAVIEIPPPVVTQREAKPISRGTVESRLKLNATFGAEQQTPLYFRNSGRVRKLHVIPGQVVEAGQILAELEAGNLPYDIEGAALDLERVQRKLENAKERVGFADGPKPLDLENYALDVKQAELKLRRLQDQMADLTLRAPFAGEVSRLEMIEGDSVAAYQAVLTLSTVGAVIARATVDESQLAQLTPGQLVEIYPNDGNSRPVLGKIKTVPPLGGRAENRVVIIAPDEPSNRLIRGRNARVEIVLQKKENVLRVPLSAIRTYSNRSFVTVVDGEVRQEVAITIGLQSDEYAEVLSGLKEGDKVVSR